MSIDHRSRAKACPVSIILQTTLRRRPATLRKASRLDLNENGGGECGASVLTRKWTLFCSYKGKSFDIWKPDSSVHYSWTDPEPVLDRLRNERLKAGKRRNESVRREFPKEHLRDRFTLSCIAPRTAFRSIVVHANQRMVIACFIPPKVFSPISACNFSGCAAMKRTRHPALDSTRLVCETLYRNPC